MARVAGTGVGGNGKQKPKPKKKSSTPKAKTKPALAPLGKLGPGVRSRRMMERKSKDAPPPEDIMPFPDLVKPSLVPTAPMRAKPYRGGPAGRKATDTPHGTDSVPEPPAPLNGSEPVWTFDDEVLNDIASRLRRGVKRRPSGAA